MQHFCENEVVVRVPSSVLAGKSGVSEEGGAEEGVWSFIMVIRYSL